jgi:hypothetical protein
MTTHDGPASDRRDAVRQSRFARNAGWNVPQRMRRMRRSLEQDNAAGRPGSRAALVSSGDRDELAPALMGA